MNRMQKLLLYASLLLVGITLLLGFAIVEEPGRGFAVRMGCLVFAEVVLCAECLVFSRPKPEDNRAIAFALGYLPVWVAYLLFTFLLAVFGGKLSMTWLVALEAAGFAVAVIVRIFHEMGGQSIARQEAEDRQALAWRKLAALKAGEAADAMLAAFPDNPEIRKAAESLRDGVRHAASSTPGTVAVEAEIDRTLSYIAEAAAGARCDEVLKLCASASADIQKRHRLALVRSDASTTLPTPIK